MKSTAIVCAIAAASLGFGSLSYAQGQERRGLNADGPRHEQRDNRRDHREDRREAREERRDDRREARRDDRHDRRDNRHDARDDRRDNRDHRHGLIGLNHGHQHQRFHRGGYLPHEYRGHQYVVHDWHRRHLSAPPYGHQWVQVNGDYVLVALATGLIANLLLAQ